MNRYLLSSALLLLAVGSAACSSSRADENKRRAPQPTADALWKTATGAFEAKRYEEASTIYKQLAKEYPSDKRAKRAYYFAALASFNLKKYAVAIDEFRSVAAAYGTGEFADDALFFAAKSSLELRRCTDASKFLDSIEDRYPKSNVRDQLSDLRNDIGISCCAKLTSVNECWFYAPEKRRCSDEERRLWDAVVTSSCGARGKVRSGRRCYTNEGVRLRLCTRAEAQDDDVFEEIIPSDPADGESSSGATTAAGSTTFGGLADPFAKTAKRKWLPRGWTDLGALAELRSQLGKKWTCRSDGTSSDGEMSIANCTVCRDMKLAFPCAEVTLNNGEVLGLSFPLRKKSDTRRAVQELTSDWGKPTRSLRDPYGTSGPVSLLCWDGNDRHAALIQRRGAGKQAEFMLMAYVPDSLCPVTP